MPRLVFEQQLPANGPVANRADVALFVGFVAVRAPLAVDPDLPDRLKTPLQHWMETTGWLGGPYQRPIEDLRRLRDIPVPIGCWAAFDSLFAWEERPIVQSGDQGAGTFLGAAVRSFFAQGGRKCYVVRAADPLPVTSWRPERFDAFPRLVPGFPNSLDVTPSDRSTWRGVGHVLGLPDVSFLCLPDLPDSFGVDQIAMSLPASPSEGAESFVECSAPVAAAVDDSALRRLRVPRCDTAGYRDWARAVLLITDLLARFQREVQLVAAFPQPEDSATATDLLRGAVELGLLDQPMGVGPRSFSSAFLQLVYPWVRTPGSARLAEQLEPPDGVLAGVLARNALTHGTYVSAGNQPLGDVFEAVPALRARDREPSLEISVDALSPVDRLTLIGRTPGGMRLLSDVTTAISLPYRQAPVCRLVSAIVRAARLLGEEMVFEVSAPPVWAQVRDRMTDLMTGLWQAGAIRGDSRRDAFSVRCDSGTMSQQDIDEGRLIVEITFEATLSIERITIVLALQDGGLSAIRSAA